MKRRIVFVLIAVLVCVGAASCFTSYTPVPDTAEIVDVLVLHVDMRENTAEDITGRGRYETPYANCCRIIRARRLPSLWHRGHTAKTVLSDSGGILAVKPYVYQPR